VNVLASAPQPPSCSRRSRRWLAARLTLGALLVGRLGAEPAAAPGAQAGEAGVTGGPEAALTAAPVVIDGIALFRVVGVLSLQTRA
jgi:hypothetical protein